MQSTVRLTVGVLGEAATRKAAAAEGQKHVTEANVSSSHVVESATIIWYRRHRALDVAHKSTYMLRKRLQEDFH